MSDATLTLTQREAEALTKMGRHFTLDDARKLAASHPEANDIHSAVQKLRVALANAEADRHDDDDDDDNGD